MTLFLQFRLWLRRAPMQEKGTAGAIALVLLGVLSWTLVPPQGPGGHAVATGLSQTTGVGSGGLAGQATGGAPATGVASPGPSAFGVGATGSTVPEAVAAGGGTISTGGAASSGVGTSPGLGLGGDTGAPRSCAGPPSKDQGVSASQLRIGFVELSLAGAIGNSAASLPSPEQQQRTAEAMIDQVNASGGIQCRKLVATFYAANPIDSTNQHAVCLQMAQDGLFAVIDAGGFSFPVRSRDCIMQNKLPLFSPLGLLPSEISSYYPYAFSPSTTIDADMRDVVLGSRQLGFFDPAKGFRKLGLVEEDCEPEVNAYLEGALAQIGISRSQTSRYVIACPPEGMATPNDMAQAVVQHKLAGVTNVIPLVGGSSFKTYTQIAQQQEFHPRYSISEYDGVDVSATQPGQAPEPHNFDGALNMTPTRYGLFGSHLPLDPATQQCGQIFTHHGLPGDRAALETGDASAICALFTLFVAAASHATSLVRTSLAAGLDQVGALAVPYPYSDAVFNRPRKVSGSDYWRPIQWHQDCGCWRVVDTAFRPNF